MLGEKALFWVKKDYFWRKMSKAYTDQTLNIASIRSFFFRRESIFLFLALTLAFAILLVVFGQPTSLTGYTDQHTSISHLGQISITFVSGYMLLLLNRWVMYFVGRRHDVQTLILAVWVVGEMVFCVSVMSLVLWALSGAGKLQLAPLVGTLVLGYIGVLLMPTVVSFLIFRIHEEEKEIQRLRQALQAQEASPQQQQDSVVNFHAKGGRLAFSTKLNSLLYVEAADNYANIHYVNGGKEDTFILHNTLKNIEKLTASTSLLRCHRCFMVNVENVRLMRKEAGGLVLELNQTQKVIPVSKSFAEPVTRYFAYNTNMPLPTE